MNDSLPAARRHSATMEPVIETIMVIDDNPTVITLVDDALRPTYRVRVSSSGAQALALLDRAPGVDLILLDVVMPHMDGFEVCRRIKALAGCADIPIIFLTALDENGNEAHGLNLGAVDYITKPVVPITLRARVATHLELRRGRRQLQQNLAVLHAERAIIEGMIIRMRADADFDNRQLRWLMQPVEQTSGDIGLAAFCPDGRQMVLAGDFTGHGLTAAIAGPGVKQAFYAACANNATLTELIATLNSLLCTQLLASQFMAAQLVEVTPTRRQVRCWGGGMPAILHADAGGSVSHITLRGFPLGVLPAWDAAGEVHNRDVAAGERLLLHTDGIIEAHNPDGEMYGSERLATAYAALLQRDGALTELVAALANFDGGIVPSDDMLLLELCI